MQKPRLASYLLLAALSSLIVYVAGGDIAHAQGTFVPLAETPGGSRLGQLYGSTSLADFINKLFYAAIAVGAILAVLRFSFAGYLYMTSDAWGQKSKAKEVIGNAILGLLLLLSIYLILRQINPEILNLDILRNIPQTK